MYLLTFPTEPTLRRRVLLLFKELFPVLTLPQKGGRQTPSGACREELYGMPGMPRAPHLPSFAPDSCVFLTQHHPGIVRGGQTKGLAHIKQVLDH